MTTVELTPVQQFYKGRSVFITGGTGFMGKVLVEKLLYSCSDIKELFLLMRSKRGKSPEQRLDDMFKLPIFQRIKDEKPHVLKKMIPIIGDVGIDGLGMSDANRHRILNETSIVFHCAATLKLEANLKDAINMNTIGTQRVLDMCKQMRNIKVFLHLSTAFCCNDQEVLMEKVYDSPHEPLDIIRCVEWMDDKILDKLTPDLIVPHPNTYTYSKRLAEMLVSKEYPNLPVGIARPSIVTPAWAEPVEGWVDSLNGPVGVLIGAGKGVIRSMMCDGENLSEIIPVDIAISGLVTIAWKIGTMTKKPINIPVYNVTCLENKKVPWSYVLDVGRKLNNTYPCSAGLWYPGGDITKSRFVQKTNEFFFHWIPAYLIDFLMLCLGQKRFMCRIQERITTGLDLLQFFTMRKWDFKSTRFNEIYTELAPEDKKIFDMEMVSIEPLEYIIRAVKGGIQYCLKEPLSNLPRNRMQLKMMYCLDRVCKILLFLFLVWSFLTIFDLKDDVVDLFQKANFVRTKI